MTRNSAYPTRGQHVTVAKDSSYYVAIPAGTTGTVLNLSGPHSTMNGGGYDVTIALDAKYRDLIAAIDARVAELAKGDPGFYTEGMCNYLHGKATIRMTWNGEELVW